MKRIFSIESGNLKPEFEQCFVENVRQPEPQPELELDSDGFSFSDIGFEETSTSITASCHEIIQFEVPELTAKQLKPFDKEVFVTDLVCWALQNKVKHTQMRGLLNILNDHFPQTELPQDPRTLLKTPRMIDVFVDPLNDGEKYWYYGLERSMKNCLGAVTDDMPFKISLNFSTDGLPISKASCDSFWPLLYSIHELPQIKPSVIGIYQGKSNNY